MNSKEKTKFRTSKEWKAFRAQLLIDRDNRCEICGISRRHGSGLNVHHHDEANYSNLDPVKFSVLCRDCHQTLEKLLRRKSFNIGSYCKNMNHVFEESKHRS